MLFRLCVGDLEIYIVICDVYNQSFHQTYCRMLKTPHVAMITYIVLFVISMQPKGRYLAGNYVTLFV